MKILNINEILDKMKTKGRAIKYEPYLSQIINSLISTITPYILNSIEKSQRLHLLPSQCEPKATTKLIDNIANISNTDLDIKEDIRNKNRKHLLKDINRCQKYVNKAME